MANAQNEPFYSQLSPIEYLDDIEIQVEHKSESYEDIHGLSEEQVSKLANDSLGLVSLTIPSVQSKTQSSRLLDKLKNAA